MGLQYHMEEALAEKGMDASLATHTLPMALFSKKYCDDISCLDSTKTRDYCFMGSINTAPSKRGWVIDFARKHFTSNSVFINTDNDPAWALLGDYDYSHKNLGFCPKNAKSCTAREAQFRVVKDNEFYFQTMCQSRYVLCPRGDAPWSFRFYEILMCKSIPVVESWHHTYRTKEEAALPYQYVLKDAIDKEYPYDDMVRKNTELFVENHML